MHGSAGKVQKAILVSMWSSLCVLSRNDCHHWREDRVYRMLL